MEYKLKKEKATAFIRKNLHLELYIFLVFVGHLLLIWIPSYPPLYDFPNHMARYYLESLALGSNPLPSAYIIQYGFMPNIGADLVMPLLLQVFAPMFAGKLFLTLSVFLFSIGATLFISQHHRYSRSGWVAAFTLFPWLLNQSFFLGFLNFYSGVGLALLVAWNSIRIAKKGSIAVFDAIFHSCFVTVLFFWHLVALGLYMLITVCYVCNFVCVNFRKKTAVQIGNRLLLLFLTAIPSFLLILYLMFIDSDNALSGGITLVSPTDKIRNFGSTLFGGYSRAVNGVVLVLWVSSVWISFKPQLRTIARWSGMHLTCGVSLIVYVLLPGIIGTTALVDQRVLPLFFICFIALFGYMPLRRPRLGIGILSFTLVIRLLSIGRAWNALSEDIEIHIRALKTFPLQSAILVNDAGDDVNHYHPALHSVAWGVIERQLLVSTLFAIPGQQPLRYQFGKHNHTDHVYQKIDARFSINEELIDEIFDYFWFYDVTGVEVQVPRQWKLIHKHKDIRIWKIRNHN